MVVDSHHCAPGKEEVPDNLLVRSPRFRIALILKFFVSAIEPSLNGFRLNINQPGPEALNQLLLKVDISLTQTL